VDQQVGQIKGYSLQFNVCSAIKRAHFFIDFSAGEQFPEIENNEAIQCPEYAWLQAKSPFLATMFHMPKTGPNAASFQICTLTGFG